VEALLRRVFTSRCGVISPQHVTLPSRILIRRPADERWATSLHRNHHRKSSAESSLQSSNDQRTIYRSPRHRVNDPPPSSDPASEPSPRNRERSYERCVERTATAILASRRAAPGLASNEPPRYLQSPGIRRTYALKRDTPKRRKRDDGRSGTETGGFARGLESLGGR